MKLHAYNPINSMVSLDRLVAKLTGQKLEVVVVSDDKKKSAEYKKINPRAQFPMLETEEGVLYESTAIAKYLCQVSGKLLGSNAVERSQVDQWVSYSNTTLNPTCFTVYCGIFGWNPVGEKDWNEAAKNLKSQAKVLNTALEGKKYLVGNQLSLADIVVAGTLMYAFQTTLDGGFRKAMKAVEPWVSSIYALPEFIDVFGKVTLCAKALKPVVVAEKKEEKKKAAPAAAAKPAEKKEEKKKDNVESLPPTTFNLYDFKTFYVNHKDLKGEAVDEFYKQLDWDGWAFWHLRYDIYEGEGAKEHITNNLLTGFLSRAEHTSKYTFGKMVVAGDEPNLQIQGCWLMRGTELPDGLVKEHPQFEYYFSRKLDPRNNKEDDMLVRDYFSVKVGDVVEGLTVRTMRWQK